MESCTGTLVMKPLRTDRWKDYWLNKIRLDDEIGDLGVRVI